MDQAPLPDAPTIPSPEPAEEIATMPANGGSYCMLNPRDIVVGRRLRSLNRDTVEALKQSIAKIGLKIPVSARRVDRRWELVAGRHRLQAALELGLSEIPIREEHGTELDARLWEIDENFCRAELNALERAEHLAERKRLHEQPHPETKEGAVQARGMNQALGHNVEPNLVPTFTEDTTEKTGLSRTAVKRSVHRAESIAPDVRDEIRGTGIAGSGVELDALAKAPAAEQAAAVKAVKSGKAKNVREALQRESAAEAENGEESELPPCLRVFLNAPAPKLSKGQQQASSSIKRTSKTRVVSVY